ncbi:MAG: type II toxin-antitoxin system VapC family toxin [Nitrospira sp.]|nr:type II toxin-antitoxin system VapC family toxin [Nitrospira sp.]MDR4463069.1 type II toxin-antitoxin system VapC family toxin [Nitrospira sp.]
MKFWDASAIIPLCLQERETPPLKRLVQADQSMVAWWGSPIECLSALARLRRDETLSVDEEAQAHTVLRALMAGWTEVEPSEPVREQAARVLRLHPLRAADSLQLAAALVWCQGDPSHREFVCLDQRLREAGRREGFSVLPRG